jgi:hypothetical protein
MNIETLIVGSGDVGDFSYFYKAKSASYLNAAWEADSSTKLIKHIISSLHGNYVEGYQLMYVTTACWYITDHTFKRTVDKF